MQFFTKLKNGQTTGAIKSGGSRQAIATSATTFPPENREFLMRRLLFHHFN
ncbi:MAG TPA: hypothetical protein V6D14_00185 [Coleofasciculaceae cyanobacterium]|jgi:hypothetical protein